MLAVDVRYCWINAQTRPNRYGWSRRFAERGSGKPKAADTEMRKVRTLSPVQRAKEQRGDALRPGETKVPRRVEMGWLAMRWKEEVVLSERKAPLLKVQGTMPRFSARDNWPESFRGRLSDVSAKLHRGGCTRTQNL